MPGSRRRGAADERGFEHADLTQKVIGVFYEVYNELGHGFLESVYEAAMTKALRDIGLRAERQWPIEVRFRGEVVGEFRANVLVEGCVIVEIKAARALESAHEAQVLNSLRATPIEVGLLMNFGPKPDFRRFAFANNRKIDRS